ncbi:MAG: DUF5123 domain-containing protein [Bacteroidales bacterium]|nr:DUF5123 domain-containing protein [Bacteroidales bacterium]
MKNKWIKLTALVLSALAFVACVDEQDLGDPDRLFRPIFQKVSKGGTWVRVEWDRFEGVNYFELELSVDSFATVAKQVTTTEPFHQFDSLDYDTEYQCRIRSFDESLNSNWYAVGGIKTDDYPTLLLSPTAIDLLDNAVRMSWTPSEVVYDYIEVEGADTTLTLALTDTDRSNAFKIVGGLKANETYVIRVYDASGAYYGKKSYTTAASQDFGENVVDLRGLTADSALKVLTQDYVTTLCAQYADQEFTIVLDGGFAYEIPSLYFSDRVRANITTGLSFAGYAILHVNSNFGVAEADSVTSLSFSKLIFTEGTTSGKTKLDSNYGGTYLFNFNKSGGNMNSLSFTDCDIRYKRGVVRLQTQATLNQVSIENCMIDSIGGYGIVNVDNAASTVLDISVKNTTLSHADKLFVATKPTVGPNSLLVENVTICHSPGSNIYLVDFNGKPVAGGIVLRNCLIGPGKAGAGINGVRSTTTTSITIDKCYRSSDMLWYTADGAAAPTSPLNDVEDAGLASAELFANAEANDYTITLESLINKVGDPRWW